MPATVNRPGGVNTTFGYDGANRLNSVHHDGPSGAIAHFDYTLDANGNRTAVVSSAGTESYTLDLLNRLTGVTYPNGDAASYTYDAAGNRLSSTLNGATTNYTYDAAGRLTAAGANSLAYDAAGNVTTNGSSSLSWDWAGRLASVTVGGTASTYTYDGDSTRVTATTGGSTTNYIWDRGASLPLLIDDGTQGYVQTDSGLVEQLGAAASFPLSDALGSVRSVVSPTASVLGTSNYDAFGSVRSQTGQSGIFGFTGQQTDPTGLSFLRSRYYNPLLGRFMSPDGVQPNAPGPQGYDLYSYAGNNPATFVDPTGNEIAGFALDLRAALIAFAARTLALLLKHKLEAILLALAIGAVAEREQVAQVVWVIIRPQPPKTEPQPKPTPGVDPGPFCLPGSPQCYLPNPTPSPQSRCTIDPGSVPTVLGELQQRAEQVHKLADPIKYGKQVVADLRVRQVDGTCVDIIGASGNDLQRQQQNALVPGREELARFPNRHAEITVLHQAGIRSPLVLGVTKAVCTEDSRFVDACRAGIATAGGQLSEDQQGAVWWQNLA